MSIEVINLSKYYGEQAAVNDISFSVKKGKSWVFLAQMERVNPQL